MKKIFIILSLFLINTKTKATFEKDLETIFEEVNKKKNF